MENTVVIRTEIQAYLAGISPFDKLPEHVLSKAADSIETAIVSEGSPILSVDEENSWLYIIRSGAVEIYSDEGLLHGHFGQGDFFGYRSLISRRKVGMPVQAIEDSLFYKLPAQVFLDLVSQHPDFASYFAPEKAQRLKAAMQLAQSQENNPLLSTSAADLVSKDYLKVETSETIQQVAIKFASSAESAALVFDEGKLQGVVTDADFCTRVAARNLSMQLPITEIMTAQPITILPNISAAHGMLTMVQNNVRHLPVVSGEKVEGMLSASDLLRRQSHNALFVVDEVHHAKTIEQLAALTDNIPEILLSLVRSSFSALDSGRMISAIGEAVTVKLLKMAEAQLGAAPVAYAWITAGSLSREEQTAKSDQDNALFLSDEYNEELHGAYFKGLADFVCDGLDACGYIYCPGDVMASNIKWRQPVAVWQEYFRQWIFNPQRKSLMYSSIFFDLRCLYGDESLLQAVQQRVQESTRGNSIFLAHMAENALHYPTPLGLFRHFVLEKGGAEKKALNMKKRGVIPVTDLARVYALASGDISLNTDDRLRVAAEQGVISNAGMADLRDAYEFIGFVRLQHQAKQIEAGIAPDNFVPPEQLSSLERRHLKDAFDVVRTLQQSMRQTFVAGEM